MKWVSAPQPRSGSDWVGLLALLLLWVGTVSVLVHVLTALTHTPQPTPFPSQPVMMTQNSPIPVVVQVEWPQPTATPTETPHPTAAPLPTTVWCDQTVDPGALCTMPYVVATSTPVKACTDPTITQGDVCRWPKPTPVPVTNDLVPSANTRLLPEHTVFLRAYTIVFRGFWK